MKMTKKAFNSILAIILSLMMLVSMIPSYIALAIVEENYATVNAFTDTATITGNGTENVAVTITEAQLKWSPVDATVGRYYAGWWVGINVIAPEGFSSDATYKVKTNPSILDEDVEAKSFASNKDTENSMQFWLGITPESWEKFIDENRNLVMTYKFDWDADEVYEQTVTFTVVPNDKIVLEKDGVQVYPLATVTTLSGGNITANGSKNVTVEITEATLKWTPADATLGRQEGWWVGINVTAPKDYSLDATYIVKSNPSIADDAVTAKKFEDNKDGANSEQFWMMVTPDTLVKFASENRSLIMTYKFDWDADGAFEQTVTFSLDPKGDIVLTKAEEQIYPATGDITIEGWTGTFDNQQHFTTVTAEGYTVKYSTDNVEFTEEEPSIFDVGKNTIYVALYKDGYKVHAQSVVLEVTPATIEGISIEALNLGYSEQEDFSPAQQELVKLSGSFEENDIVTWNVNGVDYVQKEIPTAAIPGPYNIKLTVERKNHTTYESEVVTTVITAATIEGITVTPYSGVYDGTEYKAVEVTGTRDGDIVEYSLTGEDGDYTTTCPTIKDYVADGITVYVKVKRENYEEHITFPVGFKAFVEKAEISEDDISITPYVSIYDTASHDIASFTQKYASDIVTFSSEEDGVYGGMLRVTEVAESGTYYVKISRNENYEDRVIAFEVKIEKAELVIDFEKESINETYKDKENNSFDYAIEHVYGVDKDGNNIPVDNADIINDVRYYEDVDFASIDDVTGNVKYENTGVIIVIAKIDEAKEYDNYKVTGSTVDSYTLNVVNVETSEEPVVSGSDKYETADVVWYSGDSAVVITAPVGWKIIEANSTNKQNNTVILGQGDAWSDTIVKTESSTYNVEYALKNIDSGEITAVRSISTFAIDNTDPVIVDFDIQTETLFQKIIRFLSFGVFANDKVRVDVNVNDNGLSSGIQQIILYAKDDESAETIEVELEKYNDDKTQATFIIPKDNLDDNQKLEVVLTAKVIDNVNNEEETATTMTTKNSNLEGSGLMIETIKPIITIEGTTAFDGVEEHEYNGKLIYSGDVTFKFAVEDAESGLYEVSVKVNGQECASHSYADVSTTSASYQITTEGITADENGAYVFDIKAFDCAGNEQTGQYITYVDNTAPIISGFEFTYQDENGEWVNVIENEANEKPVVITDYGYYFNKNIKVFITAEDIASSNETISGISKIVYKAINVKGEVVYEAETYFDGTAAECVTSFEIDQDFKGQIYAYAVDGVGNSAVDGDDFYNGYDANAYDTSLITDKDDLNGYVAPNGTIVESPDMHKAESSITITATNDAVSTQNNAYAFDYAGNKDTIDAEKAYDDSQLVPLYNADVKFDVVVKDTYSGIRSVKWTIFEGEKGESTSNEVFVNNEGTLVDAEGNAISADDKTYWSLTGEENSNLVTEIAKSIVVSGNHNNMVLLIELTDRAGNTSYDYYTFGIDTTKPLIKVVYNEDAVNDEQYTSYFKTNRTATITITERNFDAKDVVCEITKDGKVFGLVDLTKKDAWKETPNADDLDLTTYTTTFEYTEDGDYTFNIAYVDKAGNANAPIEAPSVASYAFTVDKTLPTVKVEYDNNTALNGNYFKADRTATITVTEHNFDASRFVLESVATDNDAPVSYPSISGWKSEGDVHVTTITYSVDAKYTFDFTFKDMASNEIADFEAQEFYIDKTNPVVSITGIVDQSANNDEGNIGFTITATDTNFDVFTPVLTAVLYTNGNFETKTIDIGSIENVANGKSYVVRNIDTDGIYSITCTVVDKAGNAYSEVILQDADGKSYTEKRAGKDKLVTFSVNRNGSTFMLNDYTQGVVDAYYVKDVTENVTIIEINADSIIDSTVTLNGETLVKGTDYTVALENGESTWYKYSYILNKSLFAEEGEYNIVVYSKDKATNEAFSDIKSLDVKFVVDRTAPVITVAGLKTNGRYQVETQVVTLTPTDDGGMIKTLIVRLVDENGNVIKEIMNLSGDALAEALEAGTITFELTEGETLYQNVQIISEDIAGNIVGAESNEIYRNITISTNKFLIFWANQPLRWGTIGGIVLIAAAIIFFIVYKKRKNEGK